MELYIGGCFQGKLAHARARWMETAGGKTEPIVADGETVECSALSGVDILNHFHLLVRRLCEAGQDPETFTRQLMADCPKLFVVCDEVGLGIVPAEKAERVYREAVGRSCCLLAAHADRVERIICGKGMRLK